ncbi:histidine-specific methyltransferase [Polychytrium aggregatum]|uniref:histidine-specific methyltransferase n=1 Tax=Polychytrium aggregatum TaxID=110093 RepID=UPI0022FF3A8B|nr:histidine-specific methyltransferase [Polychytrium aggregatum]KAI9205608.1 histidine-specific methyltransferase [Polychytrium aggregatum]
MSPHKILPATAAAAASGAEIIDIRPASFGLSDLSPEGLVKNIINEFMSPRVVFTHPDTGSEHLIRSIPTMVLYDDLGLEIYDRITNLDEYYLFNAEIDIFKRHAEEMILNYIQDDSVLVELGVGSMRKTKYLLDAITKHRKNITYYALDLSEASLRDCLTPLCAEYPEIRFVGLLGTYDDSLQWIRANIPQTVHKSFLWLGSSIGNFTRAQARDFLSRVASAAMNAGDDFFCGIDGRNKPEDVKLAYDDPKGVTAEFILNGFDHINRLFGRRVFERDAFSYLSIYNRHEGRHEAYYQSKVEQTIDLQDSIQVHLHRGEIINVEYSYKYSDSEVYNATAGTGLAHVDRWKDSSDRYSMFVFQKPSVVFSPEPRLSNGIPVLAEWESLWNAWDVVSTTMIPSDRYLEAPIALRHPYIFYLGHLPGFLDIQLSKAFNLPLTEPKYFATIFERGIDPIVDDPSQCHSHSLVPNSWPALDEVLAYRDQVRRRARDIICKLADAQDTAVDKTAARAVCMCFEHDAMHLETFLYMLVQSDHTLPPAGIVRPKRLGQQPLVPLAPAALAQVSAGQVTLGTLHREQDDGNAGSSFVFGWDNESPELTVQVDGFSVQNRPVAVQEYYKFWCAQGKPESLLPKSWTDDGAAVKTALGPVPIHADGEDANGPASRWPAYVSFDQADAYAKSIGGSLPSEEQIARIRQCVDKTTKGTSPARPRNSGFVEWTPVDVETPADPDSVSQIDDNGWELTRTHFRPFPGFETSKLYPGYSSDFFDDHHFVVLGASWATVPTIASRKTFRNWYQHNYPYVFAKFRVVV